MLYNITTEMLLSEVGPALNIPSAEERGFPVIGQKWLWQPLASTDQSLLPVWL